MVHDTVVKVLTTQMGVTGSGQNLKHTVVNGQERHVKGTATKVIDNHLSLITRLVQSIRDGRSRRFVDNAQNIQASDRTGILSGLSLRIVEVSRDRDNGVRDILSEIALSNVLHLAEDHGRHLLGRQVLGILVHIDTDHWLAILVDNLEGEVLCVSLDILVVKLASDQSLHVKDGAPRIRRVLVLCSVTHQAFFVGEGHIRRGDSVSLVVDENLNFSVLHDTHTTIFEIVS